MMRRTRLLVSLAGVSALFAFALSVVVPQTASALSGNQFQAGRIMDDSVFFNKSTMSMHSVQQFLEAKVPACDTNGSQMHSSGQTRAAYASSRGYPPPYTCLRDFRQDTPTRSAEAGLCNGFVGGNKSGAQIIVEVAGSCGINPQTLLVLLQKEQSLVTDSWPWSIQYRSATGYGCPDTAPCDAEYYGFFNQVYSAAKQFKRYALTPNSFNFRPGRTSFVQYNPNASCGGSNVFIQNQTTAGLYNFTPYQPNASALNNLYGSGDGCGAYGNRNFWRMFIDWFGSPMGPLVRTPTSGELFYSDGAQKYRVGSMNMIMEYGLGLNDVRIISQQEFDALPLASSPNTPDLTYIVKSNSDSDEDGGAIYLITNGVRYSMPSMELFEDFGFEVNQIGYMPLGQLGRLPIAGTLSNFVKASHAGYVFKLDNGVKRSILDLETYQQQNPGNAPAHDISPYVLDSLTTGPIIMNGIGTLIDPGGGFWVVSSGTWHYIPSLTAYECLGLHTLKTVQFSSYQGAVGTTGENADCTVRTSGNQQFLMDGWRRIPIDPSWGFTNFFEIDDSLITRQMIYSPTAKPLFRTEGNGALYTFENGKRRQILNMHSFFQNGYSTSDIFTTSTNMPYTIPGTGSYKLGNGQVLQNPSNGSLYVISGNTKLYISSMDTFYAYGYSLGGIFAADGGTLAAYSDGGTLVRKAKTPGASLFDSGIALNIPASLETHYGISGATPTYPNGVRSSIQLDVQATRYVKFHSSAALFYLENGNKRPVHSWDTFTSLGGNVNNITLMSDSSAALFPTGSPM